ncbi:hypothetical protein HK096_004867 [Nowakowskiella sp. JEL0078]|nr:hypothetical protein HK096_004867 [Nowakowskiella sp. JEL0078]
MLRLASSQRITFPLDHNLQFSFYEISINHLCNEILIDIFKNLSTTELKKSSKVCQNWSEIVYAILYRSINSHFKLRGLMKPIKRTKKGNTAYEITYDRRFQYVRELTLTRWGNLSMKCFEWPLLLSNFINLNNLHLHGYNHQTFTLFTLSVCLPNLYQLEILDWESKNLEPIVVLCTYAPNIQSFELRSKEIDSTQLCKLLSRTRYLRILHIYGDVVITSAPIFASLPLLHTLSGDAFATPNIISYLLPQTPALTSLHIKAAAEPIPCLPAQLSHLSRIISLELGNIPMFSDNELEAVGRVCRVEVIELWGLEITDVGLNILARLVEEHGLKFVVIADCLNISDLGALLLGRNRFRVVDLLIGLDLSYCKNLRMNKEDISILMFRDRTERSVRAKVVIENCPLLDERVIRNIFGE